MKNSILTICSVLMISSLLYSINAEAYGRRSSNNPFYIEPYAGYFIGKVKGDNFTDGDINSMYVGARLGIETARGFIIGVDYGQGTGDFDREFVGGALDGDYEQKDLGAFIGYRLSPHIRVYGSYIFKYESEFENVGNNSETDVEGHGYNAGISIKAHSSLKIGLEYQIRSLKEYASGTKINGSNKSTAYLLTLKLPVPMPFNLR